MSGPLARLSSYFDRLKKTAPELHAGLKSMISDFAKMGVALTTTAKMVGHLTRAVREARDAAAAEINLVIASSYQGDTPDQIATRTARLKKLAFDTSKDVTGTMADIEKAFAAAFDMGVTEEKLRGGVGRAGALLADAMSVDKTLGIKSISKLGDLFGVQGGNNLTALGDVLAQSKQVSGFTDFASFLHEMNRAGPVIARYGGDASGASLLLAGVSRIREEGSGTAVEAFFRELNDPAKGKLV